MLLYFIIFPLLLLTTFIRCLVFPSYLMFLLFSFVSLSIPEVSHVWFSNVLITFPFEICYQHVQCMLVFRTEFHTEIISSSKSPEHIFLFQFYQILFCHIWNWHFITKIYLPRKCYGFKKLPEAFLYVYIHIKLINKIWIIKINTTYWTVFCFLRSRKQTFLN